MEPIPVIGERVILTFDGEKPFLLVEETANVENAMQNVIDIYQEELDNSIKNFSKAIEPFILIFVGWIVLMIAIGVFSLIFAVMDSAGI